MSKSSNSEESDQCLKIRAANDLCTSELPVSFVGNDNDRTPSTSFDGNKSDSRVTSAGGLVAYYPSSGESADEEETSETTKDRTSRRKSVTSPKKRKRSQHRNLSVKIFADDEDFKHAFPTQADGKIDLNHLLDARKVKYVY